MGQIGLVVPWIQFFGQSKERTWVVMEKVDLKYGLCIGQVVLLQVVIETATWRPVKKICADSYPICTTPECKPSALLPEIRDAAGSADASPGHHHHPLVALLSDVLGDVLQGLTLLNCAATTGEKAARPIPAVCLSARKQQFFVPYTFQHNLLLLYIRYTGGGEDCAQQTV